MCRLESEANSISYGVRKDDSVNGHTEQGDRVRVIALYDGNKPLPSGGIFTRLERIDSRAGSLDDVCQAESPIRQAPIVLVCEWLR